jgi:thioester reductase-like protein
VALVERRMVDTARSVAGEIDAKRLEIVAGDIGERRLGMADADWDRLTGSVARVFHLAAIYDLAVPAEIAQRVNVDGTGNVLDFCIACSSLSRLAYVSTAYVAGLRRGVVYEHELVMGQGFKNHYESTKFQAEVWVREEMRRVPTTILRPAIVVGDSGTGETEKFDGPYYILRVASRMAKMGLATVQFGNSEAPFNVVPVDYVVAAIVAAAGAESTVDQTLHLTDPEPLTARELVTALSRLYADRDPRGRIPPGVAATSLRSKTVRELLSGTPRESIAYLNHAVTYDTRRAVEHLSPYGLKPPRFPEYADAMVRFFREHEDDPKFAPKR